MNLSNLKYLGLTAGEIKVYSTLLENGGQPVGKIITLSGLKKGDCYNKLYDLKDKGLIEEYQEKKTKHFRLVDPQRLERLANDQYQTALQAKKEVESTLPLLMSSFNLNYHKPGILMFEGLEGALNVVEDTLKDPCLEILQILNTQTLDKLFQKENEKYTRKRITLKMNKRILDIDSAYNRENIENLDEDYQKLTQTRLIPQIQSGNIQTITYIYGNKLAYITIRSSNMLSVLIEDASIAQSQRGLFELTWEHAKEITS